MQCHWGPRLTDDAFHVTRTPTGRVDGPPIAGGPKGSLKLASSEFLASGPWSDDVAAAEVFNPGDAVAMLGAFKTPSLRGVALGSPYGHGGREGSLVDVMLAYGSGGLAPSDTRAVGAREPWLLRFDVTAQWSIAQFLATLTEAPIVP